MIPNKQQLWLKQLSLRSQLTILLLVMSSVIQISLSTVRTLYLAESVTHSAQDAIEKHAKKMIDQLSSTAPYFHSDTLKEISNSSAPFLSNFVLSVFDEKGNLLVTSHQPAIALSEQDILTARSKCFVIQRIIPVLEERDGHPERGRLAIIRFRGRDNKEYVLAAATDYAAGDWIVNELIGLVMITTPLGIAIAGVVGWLIAGFAVEPLRRLQFAAKDLNPESLSQGINFQASTSETIELQDQLNRALRRIDESYKKQSRFISNVSHELRTPIATLLTESQTLREIAISPPEIRSFLRSCQEELRRLGKLIEKYLTLARLRDGSPLSVRDPCSINEVVVESIANCRKLSLRRKVRLIPTLLEESDDADALITGDFDLLCNMLDNVIRNAINFSPEGASVYVEVKYTASQFMILILDEGPGIPVDQLDSIFDRYMQIQEEPRSNQGLGLGLSIARGVAELHGGTISVRNRPGGGALFEIILNRHPVTTSQPANAQQY